MLTWKRPDGSRLYVLVKISSTNFWSGVGVKSSSVLSTSKNWRRFSLSESLVELIWHENEEPNWAHRFVRTYPSRASSSDLWGWILFRECEANRFSLLLKIERLRKHQFRNSLCINITRCYVWANARADDGGDTWRGNLRRWTYSSVIRLICDTGSHNARTGPIFSSGFFCDISLFQV